MLASCITNNPLTFARADFLARIESKFPGSTTETIFGLSGDVLQALACDFFNLVEKLLEEHDPENLRDVFTRAEIATDLPRLVTNQRALAAFVIFMQGIERCEVNDDDALISIYARAAAHSLLEVVR